MRKMVLEIKNDRQLALQISTRYHFSFYHSQILAAALENDCTIVYSEDLQNGQIIEGRLKIVNPFN